MTESDAKLHFVNPSKLTHLLGMVVLVDNDPESKIAIESTDSALLMRRLGFTLVVISHTFYNKLICEMVQSNAHSYEELKKRAVLYYTPATYKNIYDYCVSGEEEDE